MKWWHQAIHITWTPGVEALLQDGHCTADHIAKCVGRHYRGDWGVMCDEDLETNDQAARYGGRILSAYPINLNQPCKGFGENTLWVITEADRSVTIVMLPSEY